jgi:5-methylcytosine-specific restriction endonuclease McrA
MRAVQFSTLHQLGFKKYQDYLNSPIWKDKTEWIKEVFNFICQECGSKKNLQVHHLNYDSLGNENQHDVTLLCKKCHKKAHEVK